MSAFLFRLGRSSARHPFRVLGLWLVAAVAIVGAARRRRRPVRQQLPRARRRVAARGRRPERPVPEPGRPVGPHRAPHRRRPTRRRRPRARPSTRPARSSPTGHDVAGVTDPFARAVRRASAPTARRPTSTSPTRSTSSRPRNSHDATAVDRPRPRRRRAGRAHRRARAARAEGPEQRADRRRHRDHRAADRVRLRGRDGPADRDRAHGHLRRRRRGRRAVGLHGRPRVLADPVHDDRPRRRHRLRAVHRHPPPPAPPRRHERRGLRPAPRSPPPGRPCCSRARTVVIAILGLFLAGLPAISAMGVSVALVVDRRDGRRDHAAPRSARPRRHEDRQALDPPQVARDQARARDVLRPLGPPRRQPPGALRGREPRRAVRHRRSGAQHADRHPRRRQRRQRTRRSARPTTSWPTGFGRGFNGPIQVVVEVPTPADRGAVDRVHDALQADPGIAAVTAPVFNPAGDTARAHRQPDHGAAGRTHRRARPSPPVRRAAGHGGRHRRAGCRSPARRWSPT